ncbi:hypothetical protein [Williamsia soli]|uniref:hypothetical protein n=1 Tax=Williamsia soli TaxID=364929 RepID=UPI001A9F1C7F|nr:hypothetical protein [Williamsia soli]
MTTPSPTPPYPDAASSQPDSSSSQGSTVDVATQQAGEVAGTATDAGKHVAGVATEQAQQVAGEVKNQTQDLLNQTRQELTTQAAAQQQRVAGGLRALSDEFDSMAKNSENPGMATDLTRQASQRAYTVASWLEDREPGQILDEVTRFARRKPGTFLALAAGAGLLAGRLGRGLTAANSDNDSTRPSSSGHTEGAPTASLPPLQQAPTAAGYAAPPPGYSSGQHAADPAGAVPVADSPYTVPPASAPQPGHPQHPAPGVTR